MSIYPQKPNISNSPIDVIKHIITPIYTHKVYDVSLIDNLFKLETDGFMRVASSTLKKLDYFSKIPMDSILIRDCYKDLYDIITKLFKYGPTPIYLTGNPGIGKSFFVLYLLSRLLKEELSKNIIFETIHSPKCEFIFTYDKVLKKRIMYKIYKGSATGLLAKFFRKGDDTIYITDSVTTEISTCYSIRISSPDQKSSEFLKSVGLKTYYMPPWSKSEVEMVYNKISSMDKDKLLYNLTMYLFDKWGGIPRHLFPYTMDGSILNDLKDKKESLHSILVQPLIDAIRQSKPTHIYTYSGGKNLSFSTSHKILHTIPIINGYHPYQLSTVQIGSDFIKQQLENIFTTVYENSSWKLIKNWNFIQTLDGQWFYEIFVHNIIKKGNTFIMKRLSDSNISLYKNGILYKTGKSKNGIINFSNIEINDFKKDTFELELNLKDENEIFPKINVRATKSFDSFSIAADIGQFKKEKKFTEMNELFFNNIEEIKQNYYNQPSSKKITCINSISYGKDNFDLIQITTNLNQEINYSEFVEVLNKLPNQQNENNKLIFAIPSHNFKDFKQQNYIDENGSIIKSLNPLVYNFPQYAILINTQTKTHS